jgi:hypothetical protein
MVPQAWAEPIRRWLFRTHDGTSSTRDRRIAPTSAANRLKRTEKNDTSR